MKLAGRRTSKFAWNLGVVCFLVYIFISLNNFVCVKTLMGVQWFKTSQNISYQKSIFTSQATVKDFSNFLEMEYVILLLAWMTLNFVYIKSVVFPERFQVLKMLFISFGKIELENKQIIEIARNVGMLWYVLNIFITWKNLFTPKLLWVQSGFMLEIMFPSKK